MNPAISLSLHWYRGFGPDIQRNLFWWHFRLGFLTLAVERVDVLDSYRKLRSTIENAVVDVSEGR